VGEARRVFPTRDEAADWAAEQVGWGGIAAMGGPEPEDGGA
jgi:hypothetical protein